MQHLPHQLHTNKARYGAFLSAAVMLATLALPVTPVFADDRVSTDNNTNVSSNEVAEALRETTDVLASSDQTNTTSDSDSAIQAVTAGASVAIPKDASDGVTLSSTDGSKPAIDISLPNADAADDAEQVAPGTVAYPANNGSANAVQATEDGGVRMLTVIDNPNAPTTYTYKVTVPDGGHLELNDEGGAIVVDANSQTVAMVAAPWARDANGQAIKTYFTTDGQTLTQYVEHNVTGVAYPVTADPWFGVRLIDYVRWNGGTLQVYPTTFGRYWAGYAARWTAWDEVVKKAPGANRQNMADQFYCRWDFVRYRAPNKPSWNLDSWRPNVGYWQTVRDRCNAGI